jgi:hypothetical protein
VLAASDVPLWAALVIGLGGGVLGTILTINNDRGAEFRTRMLTAADEFLQTLATCFHKLDDIDDLYDDTRKRDPAAIQAALTEAGKLEHELSLKNVRVDLLFGETSKASASAATATKAFHDLLFFLRTGPGAPPGIQERSEAAFKVMEEAGERFGEDVRGDIRRTGWLRRT